MNIDYTNIFSLEGKVALVTGGAGHLGGPMARGLAAHGAHVIVVGRRQDQLEAFTTIPNPIPEEAEEREPNYWARYYTGDVTDEKRFGEIMDALIEEYGQIDILINNAFNEERKPFEEITKQEWNDGVNNILTHQFTCMQRAIKEMLTQPAGGSIINISSIYGSVAVNPKTYTEVASSTPFYAAAKAGVTQLSKYAAALYASKGIRVNCISPGPFPKPPPQGDKGRPGYIVDLANQIPMKRVGKPHELVGAALFLASNASSFVTGQNIVVDGGFTAW